MKPISFAGTCGVTNTLIGLFGDEAVFEFRRERIDHPGGEVQEDDGRQILPVLAVGGTRSVSPDTACEPRAGLTLLVPAANLRHEIAPDATRVLYRGRVWLAVSARAHYDGARVHAWEVALTEI